MSGIAISASFPLGTYTGHANDGQAELIPHPARLYSALVQAAALGSLSTGKADSTYSQAALNALDWIEANPPTGLRIPHCVKLIDGARTIAYRKEGVFFKEQGSIKYKTTPRRLSDGTSLLGSLQWIWDNPPSEDVIRTLDTLCADVPHLGEASSPVTLRVVKAETPTHRLDIEARFPLAPGALRQRCATVGRREVLDRAHAAVALGKQPSVADDKHNVSTLPGLALPPQDCLATAVYQPETQPEPDVPWSSVIAIPLVPSARQIPDESVVSVCLAMHRAIVSQLGENAAPEITGHYPISVSPSANRVAIHLLSGDTYASPFNDDRDHFLILIPRGLGSVAMSSLGEALARITRVTTRSHQLVLLPEELTVLDGASFWRKPPSDCQRLWEAAPGFVPERHIKSRDAHPVLELAGAWSLGNVMRELLPEAASANPIGRLKALTQRGVSIRGRALRTSRPRAFVHRTDRRSPVMPYRLSLRLGSLLPEQAIAAVGQSRHLGCGLLLPLDFPSDAEEVQ